MAQSKRRAWIASSAAFAVPTPVTSTCAAADELGDAHALLVVVLDEEQVLHRPVDELPGARQGTQERVAVDRLLEEPEGAGPQAPLLLVVDRDHVDRHVPRARIVLEEVEQRPAVHVGKPDIEGDRMRLVAMRQGERRSAVGRDQPLEALLAGEFQEHRGEHRIVLDDEDDVIAVARWRAGRPRRPRGPWRPRAAGADGVVISPPPLGRAVAGASWTAAGGSTGRNRVKVDPRPGALDSTISPPSRRAISRLMARPRPVPPYFRLVVPSACWNASKMMRCLSSGIPMPVSRTEKAIHSWPARRGEPSAEPIVKVTPPFSVNLNAFESRLRSTCCRRFESRSNGGRQLGIDLDHEVQVPLFRDLAEGAVHMVREVLAPRCS